MAEVIKYGLIRDLPFLEWLEANMPGLMARDGELLAQAIERSCANKAEVVAADELETAKEGGRALLNLGHTFGHAIETGMGYGEWLHGEAVAAGTVMAAELSRRLGWLSEADLERVEAVLQPRRIAGQGARVGRGALPGTDVPRQKGDGRQPAPCAAQGAWPRLSPMPMRRARDRIAAIESLLQCLIWRPMRWETPTAAAVPIRRAATQGAQRVSARPGPDRPLDGLSPPRIQDPGLRQSRGRPVPYPPDAQHRGRADRTRIARALRLNDDLAEAIALAHDLGHTPFGHAGQDALNDCMQGHGGFEHNLQSLRIVDLLEERYGAFDGLNLMFETREGILKHCSPENAPSSGELGERFLKRPAAFARSPDLQSGRRNRLQQSRCRRRTCVPA
jgi:hypothetical protein